MTPMDGRVQIWLIFGSTCRRDVRVGKINNSCKVDSLLARRNVLMQLPKLVRRRDDTVGPDVRHQAAQERIAPHGRRVPHDAHVPPRARHRHVCPPHVSQEPDGSPVVAPNRGYHHRLGFTTLERVNARNLDQVRAGCGTPRGNLRELRANESNLRRVRRLHRDVRRGHASAQQTGDVHHDRIGFALVDE